MDSKKTGTAYEVIAADYLKQQGVHILKMNYRTLLGEIDIIARKKEILIFIEVKYRKNASYGYPWEAISLQKQKKICQVIGRDTHEICNIPDFYIAVIVLLYKPFCNTDCASILVVRGILYKFAGGQSGEK